MKHCSNCGERIVGEQQFCRSCGVELTVAGGKRGIAPRTIIIGGLFGCLLGALIVLFGGFMDIKAVAFAGTVFAPLSFGVMLLGAILADSPRRSRRTAAQPDPQPPVLEKADTTNQLPPITAADHFPTSVTEQTTTKLRVR
ncbi:MAG: hypothetical protein ABL984_15955 [Pyrinomonadaceae bacterium]